MAVNATRVLPVRVRARRPTGGMAEVLLIEPRGDGVWEALARPARKLAPGIRLVAGGGLEIEIVERLEAGRMLVRPIAPGTLEEALRGAGEMPLPPYITRAAGRPGALPDGLRATAGSAAAPTAGLHFTPELLAAVRERCTVVEVDLRDRPRHVPLGGRRRRRRARDALGGVRDRPGRARPLRAARPAGRRVVAVGTTTVARLETVADAAAPDVGRTSLKIHPPYRFGWSTPW